MRELSGPSGRQAPVTARHVALLRGVNVGGRNKLPMAGLRALFVDLGFTDVATLIQSGNVVFTASRPPEPNRLEEEILERFSLTTTVVARDEGQIHEVVEANPFKGVDPERVHVAFLPTPPDVARLDGLDVAPFAPDRFATGAAEVYFDLPNGMARTRLFGTVERRLRVAGTIRNLRTTVRLGRLVAEPPVG